MLLLIILISQIKIGLSFFQHLLLLLCSVQLIYLLEDFDVILIF